MAGRRIVVGCPRESGFTLVELVTVMILIGILSVFVMPRFFDNTFSERGFHDAVKAAVQHARRTAVASRRFVCVTVTPGEGAAGWVSVDLDQAWPEALTTPVACGTAVPLPTPGGCAANRVCSPKGVTLGPVTGMTVVFDPLGRSVTTAKVVQATRLNITVSNQPDITIESETGWVQ